MILLIKIQEGFKLLNFDRSTHEKKKKRIIRINEIILPPNIILSIEIDRSTRMILNIEMIEDRKKIGRSKLLG
jgi:hypothetical protein